MAINLYCDGSKKKRLRTLAGVAAPEDLWPRFEEGWKALLDKHHLLYWHTADAMSPHEPYRNFVQPEWRPEWTLQHSQKAKEELENFLLVFLREEADRGFQVRTCIVDLHGYRKVKEGSFYLRPLEAICVNSTCAVYLVPDHAELQIIFDENEKFLTQIKRVWDDDCRKSKVKWARQVTGITHARSEDVLPIQASDLIAWNDTQRSLKNPVFAKAIAVFQGRAFSYYDRDRVEGEYPPEREKDRIHGQIRAGWKNMYTRRLEAEEGDDV